MSGIKESEIVDSPCVHIISDSDSEPCDPIENGFAGFPSVQKRLQTAVEQAREFIFARKKPKIDGDIEEIAIDIDSISTNPRRTRTKVSSDTSSKFPVSSPSDGMPVGGHRKKYVKNTLPAGAFERMLNEVAQNYPLMTFQDKLTNWTCCDDLSDVEDVNNFDTQFQRREQQYKKSSSARRSTGKDSPHPNYNYQHFRTVILESFKGSPISCTPSPDPHRKTANNVDAPSTSKELDCSVNPLKDSSPPKPDSSTVILYEKVLCPSSESSATKASPSIRLHWTDEESVFRLNRLNPEIDKFSKLIKMRIDYKKQINLKAKINEIFKTPTVPPKYNGGYELPDDIKISQIKPVGAQEPKVVHRKIETRRSTGGKSADSSRRSMEKFPEAKAFQQDEFCNYLGLGMNGKVYSPTPTDNKRRSLRVKRQQQQIESVKKKKEEKDASSRVKITASCDQDDKANEKEAEVTTTVNETRNSLSSPMTIKILQCSTPEAPPRPQPPILPTKSPEIKIVMQIRNSPTTTIANRHTPSTATTANSAPQPTRRIRRTRATSNGTSTCPRSSQSDDSPSKATPRRRRVNIRSRQTNQPSDLSESMISDSQMLDGSPHQNGRSSTVPSSADGRKDHTPFMPDADLQESGENLHKKFQRYLEESRKTKPSIFIVDSIDNGISKMEQLIPSPPNNNNVPTKKVTKEKTHSKVKPWLKKRKIHHRMLRRNGAIGSMINQRILRNRVVMRPLRIKISKLPMRKKLKLAKNKQLQKQSAVEKESPTRSLVEQVQEENIESVLIEDPIKEMPVDTFPKEQCELSQDELPSDKGSEVMDHEKTFEDAHIQTEPCSNLVPIDFLTIPSSRMRNPLMSEKGSVIYAYYELDILTVVQDFVVTFWKTSKLIQILSKSTSEWMYLGECKRLLFDEEIKTPYKNRICVHNSIPLYVEMRAKELSKIRRDCNLISVYINVYYFHDEDLMAKTHSIQLDTVASLPQHVVYTTITDSRYFVMCWSQETILGKPRSGLCKYSLTPHLDTLASIREFKSMRHEIRYLECTTDDSLIGFGDTQITLWDHRSGDILMNYDLDFKLGRNFGSIYYPSLEVGQNKTVIIFQQTSAHELSVIAINISHNAPSHRFICTHVLPVEFEDIESSMRTDDYVILTNAKHQELWIDCSDPQYMIQIKSLESHARFYARCKQTVIEMDDDSLALESLSNFVLKKLNVFVAAAEK